MSCLNISFSAAQSVATICKDMFKAVGVNCFSYSHVYKDGSRAELWTDPIALEYMLVKKNILSGHIRMSITMPVNAMHYLRAKSNRFPTLFGKNIQSTSPIIA